MIILNCPKCSEAVTMASGLRPTSRVRCPLCQEEYVLADALGKLPPSLIPLDTSEADADSERPLEPTWETSGDENEASTGGETPAFAFDSSSAASTSVATGAAPRLVTRPRPKRKPKNPLMEVVKVVGGGVAGLFIAQLILWWFPIKDKRRDPFELAPKVASISWLRFIVPQQYWPDLQNSARAGNGGVNGSGGLENLGEDNRPAPQDLGKAPVDWNAVIGANKGHTNGSGDSPAGKPGQFKPNGSAKAPAANPTEDLILDDLSPKPPTTSIDPVGGVKIDLDSPFAKPVPAKTPQPSKTVNDLPSDDESVKPSTPPDQADPEGLPQAAAKASTPAEVQQQVDASRAAGMAWLNSGETDRNERRRLGEAYYDSLARLAALSAAVSASGVDASTIRAAIDELGRETLADSAFSGLVEFLGKQHLADPKSGGRGIALSGKLKLDSDTTEQPHLIVEVQGKESLEAIIVIPSDSPVLLKAGQRVFVLGVVATKPDDHRPPGDTRPVVVSSVERVVVVPATPAGDADPTKQ